MSVKRLSCGYGKLRDNHPNQSSWDVGVLVCLGDGKPASVRQTELISARRDGVGLGSRQVTG